MDRERHEDDENEALNAVGAAGQSTDPNVAEPVSGMPAGGPHDLGEKASRKQDATGQA
ncbi:hypothetical protein GON01_04725 [Sphingomonas sp. MAH-20]|jgi:hypothetical protein|uniref:Uncharacterized protein n=1 Tax=Sphingomonas horti TaxID=2682842 RepID=A0A6I4IZJ4_9SPHN|nr:MULTISPECIES: hypothetical protein [Sphingomonas]MBA2918276.1 hypothetical protein [Sphingomonas sp. CGMCC 1.13658]MVO77243.1 hypothetical protein [Sphingomonas horti]